MQGTPVQLLVQEDLTCLKATKPVNRNCWLYTQESLLCNKRSHRTQKPITTIIESLRVATKTQSNQK